MAECVPPPPTFPGLRSPLEQEGTPIKPSQPWAREGHHRIHSQSVCSALFTCANAMCVHGAYLWERVTVCVTLEGWGGVW